MASNFRTPSGVDFDDYFEPDTVGDGPSAADFRRSNGAALKYASAAYGTPGGAVNMRGKDGVDIGPKWAKKGTASYNDAIVIPFGSYQAESSDSHDSGATFTFTISSNGTWSIAMTALHETSGTNGSPLSGNWHKSPASGVGNDYEMQATATFTVTNTYKGDSPVTPSYTATTGWLSLSASQSLAANTSHLLGGGAGTGMVSVSGHWTLSIRKKGGTQTKASTLNASVEAST